jgi:chaperonin GroES
MNVVRNVVRRSVCRAQDMESSVCRERSGKSMATKLTPMGDRLLVERLEAEEKTAGGIVLPDAAKEKPIQGKVIAVGPGRRNDDGEFVALQVKKGDTILFGKYSGTEVKVDGDEYLIMKEDDVLAIVG